jgi:tight adherence protein B
MNIIVVICFLVILALLLLSISVGLRFYEARNRKKLISMLRTVTENGQEQHVNILLDDRRDGPRDSQTIVQRLERLLAESGLGWNLTRLGVTSAMAFVGGSVLGLAIPTNASPLIRVAVVGACASSLPLVYVNRARTKRLDQLEAQMPDALDFLARSMRAGHAFAISLEMVGQEIHDPLGQEFRALFNEQNLGASLERSLTNFYKRVPLADVRFFSSAVLLQRQTGGNLSEILNRLSHIIRERFQLKGQVKAASAHGRLTATILTLLPIATLVGLMLTSPGYLQPMLDDPTGRKIVALGIMAQIVGNFFIRKIIRIKV